MRLALVDPNGRSSDLSNIQTVRLQLSAQQLLPRFVGQQRSAVMGSLWFLLITAPGFRGCLAKSLNA